MTDGIVDRIFGVETEFGTLVADPSLGSPEAAVELIKETIFDEFKLGLIDIQARDEVFEPARSGGFLINGARLYVDAVGSHLEYATAECRSLTDLIANDRAGQRHIVRAIKELGLQEDISVYNNSVDHFGGHTFGCHENYLIRADEDLLTTKADCFYPFLITRQIFAGVGRVGGHVLTAEGYRPTYESIIENPVDYIWVSHVYGVFPDESVQYQLSQRADHILKTTASRVRFNRALINPKWETYYTYGGYTRLHMLFGEANQSEYAYALKVGTTNLVLRCLEDNLVPSRLALRSPIRSLRQVSRDATQKWLVELSDGTTISAIDLQREYLALAQRYAGTSADVGWVLAQWEDVLDCLESNPRTLANRLDWVAKLGIVEDYMADAGTDWSDDALHSVDLEYHNIDPDQSLFYALQMERITTDLDILDAMTDPPQDTRARVRSKIITEIMDRKNRGFYAVDWNGVARGRHDVIELLDPFENELPES